MSVIDSVTISSTVSPPVIIRLDGPVTQPNFVVNFLLKFLKVKISAKVLGNNVDVKPWGDPDTVPNYWPVFQVIIVLVFIGVFILLMKVLRII